MNVENTMPTACTPWTSRFHKKKQFTENVYPTMKDNEENIKNSNFHKTVLENYVGTNTVNDAYIELSSNSSPIEMYLLEKSADKTEKNNLSFENVELRQGRLTSGIIGLAILNNGTDEEACMYSIIDESSTADDPVIRVHFGEGKTTLIHINEINPGSATEGEIFALCSYLDSQNGTVCDSSGAWQTINYLRNMAVLEGKFLPTNNISNVTDIPQNWKNLFSLYNDKLLNVYNNIITRDVNYYQSQFENYPIER